MGRRRAGFGWIGALLLLAVLLLSSCAEVPGSYYRSLNYGLPGGDEAQQQYTSVKVYYVTTRGTEEGWPFYAANPVDGVRAGTATVRIDKTRPIGGTNPFFAPFEREAATRDGELSGRPAEAASLDAFYTELDKADAAKPVLLFVHGFNVTFPAAVTAAAKMAYDLGGGVVPVVFSWPSAGKFEQYIADENNAHLSGAELANLLKHFQSRGVGAGPLHVVAHSMGSRVTLYAIENLVANSGADQQPWLQTLTLAAPDVDRLEFRAAVQSAKDKNILGRVTVYVAERDIALEASRRLHGRSIRGTNARGRAGQAGVLLALVPGCDTVDVTLADLSPTFHSYLGTNRAVLNDLYLSLIRDLPPEQRNLYRATTASGDPFWLIRP